MTRHRLKRGARDLSFCEDFVLGYSDTFHSIQVYTAAVFMQRQRSMNAAACGWQDRSLT